MTDKLWMVIYITVKIGGTIGPLLGSLDDCRAIAADKMSHVNPSAVTPEGLTLKDVRIECEFHDVRPENQF